MEKQKLNPTIVYVLSIFGLLCCCIGGIGFILAGIAFYLAVTKLKEAKLNPDDYDPSSIKAMNTAKIIALIILIINILYLLRAIYSIYTIGWDEIMEQSQEMMQEWQQQN